MSEGRQQISCPPSCPERVCFDFTDGCTSRCHRASCAKQHPANNCPQQRVLIPISVPRQWELGTKFPSGDQTARFSKSELLLSHSQWCQATAVGGLNTGDFYPAQEISILHRNPPLLQSPWCRAALGVECGSSCCPPTAARDRHPLGLEVQHRPPRLNHLPGFTA